MIRQTRNNWIRAAMKMVGSNETEEIVPSLRFELREEFLQRPEAQLLDHLIQAMDGRAIVCPKVKATDVVRLPNAGEQLDEAVRIDRKRIDYLVCDQVSRRPVCAIQLDRSEKGRESVVDDYLERALVSAGLTVLHIRTDRVPSIQMVRERIFPLLEGRSVRRDVRQPGARKAQGSPGRAGQGGSQG